MSLTISDLNEMARHAETGEQWAEICRFEAEILGTRLCPACGVTLHPSDTLSCKDIPGCGVQS